jgi:mono/diheme cytochrome c family protein
MSALRCALALLLLGAVAGCRPSTESAAEAPAPPSGAAAASPAPPSGEAAASAPPSGEAAAGETAAATLPLPDLGYDAREGRALFQYYCSTCHGAEGHGDGFNAYNLDPKPRDLSDPAFQAGRSDAELAAVIRSGGPAAGLSTGMPPWGRTLAERRIRELVIYLRTLKPEED